MKIKKYLKLLLSPLKIETISIAIKIKLFDLLQEDISLEAIVKQLKFDSKNTKIFLDSLVLLKLLKFRKNLYRNNSFSNKYLVSSSDHYFGDVFLYRKDFFETNKKNLFLFLENGNTEKAFEVDRQQWEQASEKYFQQEQKALLSDFVVSLIAKLDTHKNIKSFLDIGCSSGILSLEILKANSDLKATLFDFKEVLVQTEKNIKKYNFEDRVTTLDGDIQKDDIKDGYDLILCSNILHLLKNKEEVLKKIYNSLNKNGILLILQNNFLEKSQKNQHAYFYNIIPMMQNRDFLDSYEFSNMILSSGFKSINSFLSEESLHINTKVYVVKK